LNAMDFFPVTLLLLFFLYPFLYIYIFFFIYIFIDIFLFYLLFFITRAQIRVGNEQNCSLTERSCRIPTPNRLAKLSLANTQKETC